MRIESEVDWQQALCDPQARAHGCPTTAHWLGAEALIVLLTGLNGNLLPAPGFPQGLEQEATWAPLLSVTSAAGRSGTVRSPFTDRATEARLEPCGSLVIALLGGTAPTPARLQMLASVAPLLERMYEAEHRAHVYAAHSAAQRETAERLATVARNLDETNTRLQEAVSGRDRSLSRLELLNKVGHRLASEHDLAKLVQEVTDAATRGAGADFGAFFYNVVNEAGESYTLYTLSGAPREAFEKFPLPRNTAVFAPTFEGTGVVRSDDIRQDPRYGRSAPYHGMPKGHLPVVSYLAVPVISRTGEVLGGLFFGHKKPGVFGEAEQTIVEGLAAQAGVAIDNARLYERLQQSIQARDVFLSLASHELRTPLTTLALQSEFRLSMLRRGKTETFSSDKLERMLQGDVRQFSRLSRLVDDMLDIARINAGRLEIHPEPVDLTALVQETLERHQEQVRAAGVEVKFEVSGTASGTWDRLRIEQVFTNLLTNALKYAPNRPLEVAVEGVDGEVRLRVRDHGRGIAKEHQSRIFQRFERAISGNEVSGLGLGLYIVKQLVERHGGRIDMKSALGEGAEFTVVLPREAPPQPEQAAPSSDGTTSRTS